MTPESMVRLGVFLGVLGLMLLLEWRRPRRSQRLRALRWPANLGIVVVDAVLLRLLLPAGAIGTALLAGSEGFGLFNLVALPVWLEGALAFLALDCLIYWQHRLFHRIPMLWRLHRVHHSDLEFDATTALRFHPVEILLSMLIKMAAVAILGAPVLAVLVFEIVLNAAAMFNHANLKLPLELDRALRRVVVTPDMHRVHHSTLRPEHDSNYGFSVSWWDYLFRSYTAQPKDGHTEMDIGLPQFRELRDHSLTQLLIQPARSARP